MDMKNHPKAAQNGDKDGLLDGNGRRPVVWDGEIYVEKVYD